MAQSPKSKGQTPNRDQNDATSATPSGAGGGGTPSFDQIIEMLKGDTDGRQRPPAPQLRRLEDSTPPSSIPPLEASESEDPFGGGGFEEDPLEASGGALNFGEGDLFGEEGFNFNFDDADIDMSLDPFAEPTGELTPAPSTPREPSLALPNVAIEVDAKLSEREISAPPLSRSFEEGESRVPSAFAEQEGGWGQSSWEDEGPEDLETRPIGALSAEPNPSDAQPADEEDLDESSDLWSRPPKGERDVEGAPEDPFQASSEELAASQLGRVPEFSTYPPAAPPPMDEVAPSQLEGDPWQEAGGIMLDEEEVSSDPIVFPSEPDPAYTSSVVGFVSPGDSAPPEEYAAASGIPGASVIHVPTDAPTSMPLEVIEPEQEEPELILDEDEMTRVPSSVPSSNPSEAHAEEEVYTPPLSDPPADLVEPTFNFISTDEVKELEEVDQDESEESPTVDLDDTSHAVDPVAAQPSAIPPEEDPADLEASYDGDDPLVSLVEESQDAYVPDEVDAVEPAEQLEGKGPADEPADELIEAEERALMDDQSDALSADDEDEDEYEPELISSEAFAGVDEDLDDRLQTVDPQDQTFEAQDPIALHEDTPNEDTPSDGDEPDTSLGLPQAQEPLDSASINDRAEASTAQEVGDDRADEEQVEEPEPEPELVASAGEPSTFVGGDDDEPDTSLGYPAQEPHVALQGDGDSQGDEEYVPPAHEEVEQGEEYLPPGAEPSDELEATGPVTEAGHAELKQAEPEQAEQSEPEQAEQSEPEQAEQSDPEQAEQGERALVQEAVESPATEPGHAELSSHEELDLEEALAQEGEASQAPLMTFEYHPLELPQPQLEAGWFDEHPLPSVEHLSAHQQEALSSILESLYLALKVCSSREHAVTHLCDLASLAHEQVGAHDFALACALKAFTLDPHCVTAQSRSLRLITYLSPERAQAVRDDLMGQEVEVSLLSGHIAEANNSREEALVHWRSTEGVSPLYLPFAAFMSALSAGEHEAAVQALDEVLTSADDPELRALLMSERLRLIAYRQDANATRSAIFRAVSESGSHATPSLLARIEREALNSQDIELLLESLRLRLGLSAINCETLSSHSLTTRSKDVGYLYYRLGWLLERAQRSEEAFYAYELASSCVTSEAFILLRLVSLARTVGNFERLREALAQLAHQAKSAQDCANLLYQRGLVALYDQGDTQAARRDFELALQRFPTFSSALATLGEMARQEGDVGALQRSYSDEIEALERQLDELSSAINADEKVYHAYLKHTLIRRCYQLGTLLQEQLGESEVALTYHLKALGLDPAFTPSLLAIEEIYERQGRWSRLVTLYHNRLDRFDGDPAKALPLRLAIADLSSAYLNDDRTANRHYAQVATFDGSGDLYALRRASETFERIGEHSSSILIEKRRAKLYKVEHNQDERCGLRAASLQEYAFDQGERLTSNAAAQALPIYQQSWQAQPSPASFDGLWRTALKARQHESLNYYLTPRTLSNLGSKLLVTQAAEALLITQQSQRAVELLEIWSERSSEALDTLSSELIAWAKRSEVGSHSDLEDAGGLDPRPLDDLGWRDYHSRARAEQQVEVMSHEGDWRGANQALVRLASMLPAEEQASIWYRIGYQTELGLKNMDEAVSRYRHALRLDPTNLFALAALRRLAWVRGDLSLYHEVMAAYLTSETHAETLQALYTHLGDLSLYAEGEEARAFEAYGEALTRYSHEGELSPMPIALQRRYLLHAQRGSWAEALTELKRYMSHLTPASKAIALDWIAVIYELHVRDDDAALATNLSVIDLDPNNSRARRSTRRLLALKGDQQAYLKHLKSEAYMTHSELDSLAVFTRCAHLYEALGEPKKAERFWRKAFKVDPEFIPASQGIGRVMYAREGWTELVSLYRKELQAFPERSPGRVDVLRRLAELYERRLDRARVAATCYEDILEILPHDPVSLSGLDRIYSSLGDFRSLAHVWSKHAEHLTDKVAQGAALLRVGELYLAAGAEEEALNAYEHAYAVAPSLHPAAWAIEMIMYPRQGSGRLIELYRTSRRHVLLPLERQILTYKMVLELSPNQIHHALKDDLYDEQENLEILWWKVYTATERGDERGVATALFELAQRIKTPEDAYSIGLEAAHRISKGDLNSERARGYWERLLTLNPRSFSAWVALVERAFLRTQKTRQWSEYRSLLARQTWVSDEPRKQAQALWTQGALEVRGIAEPQGGSGRLSAELLEEAKRACPETLTPDLIALYLPQVKSRSVLIEHLRSLIERSPIGEMRGAALLTLADLEAYDAPEDALKLALEAAKNHQPSAIEVAQQLYAKINNPSPSPAQGDALDEATPLDDGEPVQAEADFKVEGDVEAEVALDPIEQTSVGHLEASDELLDEEAEPSAAVIASEEVLFDDESELEDEDDSAES